MSSSTMPSSSQKGIPPSPPVTPNASLVSSGSLDDSFVRKSRREKREKSIRSLQQEIQLQLESKEQARYEASLEEEQAKSHDSITVGATSTVTRMTSEQLQAQAEAMVHAAISAEEEARNNPQCQVPMTEQDVQAFSETRAKEIVRNNTTNDDGWLDRSTLIQIQTQALEHAITNAQLVKGIYLYKGDVESNDGDTQMAAATAPASFPDPSILLTPKEKQLSMSSPGLTGETTPLLSATATNPTGSRRLDYSGGGDESATSDQQSPTPERFPWTRTLLFIGVLGAVVGCVVVATQQQQRQEYVPHRRYIGRGWGSGHRQPFAGATEDKDSNSTSTSDKTLQRGSTLPEGTDSDAVNEHPVQSETAELSSVHETEYIDGGSNSDENHEHSDNNENNDRGTSMDTLKHTKDASSDNSDSTEHDHEEETHDNDSDTYPTSTTQQPVVDASEDKPFDSRGNDVLDAGTPNEASEQAISTDTSAPTQISTGRESTVEAKAAFLDSGDAQETPTAALASFSTDATISPILAPVHASEEKVTTDVTGMDAHIKHTPPSGSATTDAPSPITLKSMEDAHHKSATAKENDVKSTTSMQTTPVLMNRPASASNETSVPTIPRSDQGASSPSSENLTAFSHTMVSTLAPSPRTPSLLPLQPSDTTTRSPAMATMQSPSSVPSSAPTVYPISRPTFWSILVPKNHPVPRTDSPSHRPSAHPTTMPSSSPSEIPTGTPTTQQTAHPQPTRSPTALPSIHPSRPPTASPSMRPTLSPTFSPTFAPTLSPSDSPTRLTPPPTPPPTLPAIVEMAPLPPEADWYFASILLDDVGFHFPSEIDVAIPSSYSVSGNDKSSGKRRLGSSFRPIKIFFQHILRSKPPNVDIDWSLGDWKMHKSDAEAVREYYLAKAMALENALERPSTEKKAKDTKRSIDGSKWAFDWDRDSHNGMKLAKTYAAIGETIEDHYREAFGATGRHSYSRALKKTTPTPPISILSWQSDWERGMEIAKHFDALANLITDHYFDLLFGSLEETAIKTDQDRLMAALYALQGSNLAQYYRGKSHSCYQFYSGEAMSWLTFSSDKEHTSSPTTGDALMLGEAIESYYHNTYGSRR
jgi:hypothetical protein